MKTSIKKVVTSDNWIITSIMQGLNGSVRIDARTRYRVEDGVNHFSEWCSYSYVDRLLKDKYGKKHNEMNCYRY